MGATFAAIIVSFHICFVCNMPENQFLMLRSRTKVEIINSCINHIMKILREKERGENYGDFGTWIMKIGKKLGPGDHF